MDVRVSIDGMRVSVKGGQPFPNRLHRRPTYALQDRVIGCSRSFSDLDERHLPARPRMALFTTCLQARADFVTPQQRRRDHPPTNVDSTWALVEIRWKYVMRITFEQLFADEPASPAACPRTSRLSPATWFAPLRVTARGP
ncbi:hypothetical protein [Actinoplanes awajinensis]|uniref:hypothetical protein n=1 Tax=Actinoplanes awajinensis TaxID=135946 RepID=UPI0012FB747A|nr:hypothetical protein [Actinoplanes awajinensis]